jgi:hypothetical protein
VHEENPRRHDAGGAGMELDLEMRDSLTDLMSMHDAKEGLERDRLLQINLHTSHQFALVGGPRDQVSDQRTRGTSVHGIRSPRARGERGRNIPLPIPLKEGSVVVPAVRQSTPRFFHRSATQQYPVQPLPCRILADTKARVGSTANPSSVITALVGDGTTPTTHVGDQPVS